MAAKPPVGFLRGLGAGRSLSPPGLMSTLKSTPRTEDRRARVDSDGSCSPDSSRAMFGCRIPSLRASSASWCASWCPGGRSFPAAAGNDKV